ncbi:MAG: Asp23/Gls24 family envelope stress response protein [Clostridia bacterium]|jgi:uncharacterized alkaline shock family protein YloU|nr:Asp23/Gls24 family envelope stress response protein [Clostridia bacterium]MBQ9401110.1 Asp23/Gls24 family envelope stress response protein [Clostridia bacterium]
MAAKTDKKPNNPLPVNTDDLTPSSNITYNNEVVAIIAGLAANEVEGIAGMCNVSGSLMSKNRNVTKGVKVEVGSEEVAVDLYVIVEYGIPIQRAAADAQENVRKAIESMTGLHVVRVDVHVQSVSFEQDKKALQAGVQNAALAAGEVEQETVPVKAPEKKAEEKAKPEPKTEPAKAPEQEPVKKPEDTAAAKPKAEKAKAEPAPKAKKPAKKAEKPEEKKEDGKDAPEA